MMKATEARKISDANRPALIQRLYAGLSSQVAEAAALGAWYFYVKVPLPTPFKAQPDLLVYKLGELFKADEYIFNGTWEVTARGHLIMTISLPSVSSETPERQTDN